MPELSGHFNFWVYAALLMVGMYGMIAKKNLVKKLIGLSIFQTAIILFYVSISPKSGATIPIARHEAAAHGAEQAAEQTLHALDPLLYDNPLPHVLMLTAIVVGVATLGLGLALIQRMYREFGSSEENVILDQLEQERLDD